MSSIEEYRRQLKQQIAVERAHSNEPRWSSRLESLGAEDVLGSPQGDMIDVDNLREAVVGARLNPDPAFRAEALGQIVSKSERSTAHQLPLEILSNPQETVQVRLAALRLLELLAISSPTFPEWRPAYLESLRIAIETSELRRQIVDQPPDERTLEAAIRHLAGDPSSVDRLRALVSDRQKTITARKLAAAALNALAPESLPVPDTQRSNNIRAESADVEAAEDPVEEFVRILASRRRRPS